MKRLAALAVLLAAAAFSGGVGRSQATFVAGSDQADQTFGSSAAFNGVAVSLADPGTPLRATVPLSATASSDRSLVSVTFQRSPAGAGTWTTICAPAAAPYTCSWNSAGVADGLYDLRATALDASGYSRTSTVGSRRVDNTAPAVNATAATPLTGSATVSATATDGGSGVLSVAFEARPSSGGAWAPICTDGSSPYSCSWNTTALADGAWDVRATATDNAGNTSSSTTTNRIVDNTAPSVSVTDPGSPIGGTITLASTTGDGSGSGVASVAYQYRTSPSGTWTAACSSSTAPFSCSWATPATGTYDLRAIATDGVSKTTTSAVVSARQVDNTIPATATMTNPGSPLTGTVTLNGAGTDANSGMDSMRFEYKPSSGSTWSTACTDAAPPSPFSCAWDTTTVADGSYDVRSVAIDNAGNVRNSATITARIVDNSGPALTVTSPGMFRGTATINATATDATGVAAAGVTIQYSLAGANSWTTICTDASAPYSCSWNSAGRADGAYDLRAIATDTLGNQGTSALGSAYVNNTGPTGSDVQGTNGGVNDRLDAGDTVVFSYSAAITPSSILPGWNGAAPAAIRVRVANNGTTDSMTFYDAANTTPLGLLATGTVLNISLDYVSGPTVFNATIARSGSTFTVTIGSLISGTVRPSAKGKNDMVWRPSSQATSLATGIAVWPTTVTEGGGNDNDF
jgi:hypothetical protein